MSSPRIFLAIDNCFASKRWTRPTEWTRIVKDLGLAYVEASADNECDPLYMDPDYLKDWLRDVGNACSKTGVTVANLYSGHGTYTALGLASIDARNRRRMLERWLKPMIGNAAGLGAGLGFFCHAFCDSILQDRTGYAQAEDRLYGTLSDVAAYARRRGLRTVGVEQMYTPHQAPWTIQGSFDLLREVWARSGAPFYLTIDTGHQSGQQRFQRPNRAALRNALRRFRSRGRIDGLWLGPNSAYTLFQKAAAASKNADEDRLLARLEREMERFRHLFADPEDGDPYLWLEQLGCYSPIIHLQQTDGMSSSHLPFTARHNDAGIIRPDKVLKAIASAYARAELPGLPPRCQEIYLTLEPFSATAAIPADILQDLAESVAYWRRYIPKDGIAFGR